MRRMFCGLAIAAIAALGPTWVSASEQEDKEVAQQIAGFLRDSGKVKKYSIGVKYKDATVWLNGRVTSKDQEAMALQVVSEVPGVDQIVNNLEIGPAPAPAQASGVKLATAQVPQAQPRQRQAQRPPLASAPSQYNGAQAGYTQMPAAAPGAAPMGPGGPMGPMAMASAGGPMPAYMGPGAQTMAPMSQDQPHMPNYAWPSYAAHPNYAALTYPKQYSPTAWPFIGPFYPYPQVPLGWRKVTLEWDDGWWFLDFNDRGSD